MASLTERIKHAASVDELEALLDEGKGYENASDKTRRTWQKVAAKRRIRLLNPIEK